MSYKIKSVVYFASFVIALVTYYHVNNSINIQNSELANNVENVTTIEAMK